MCGVIGIFNFHYSNIIILELINSLKKLQNRGRDSYGVLLLNKDNTFLLKSHELINLDKVKEYKLQHSFFNIALGHSRYATSYISEGGKNNIDDSHPLKGIHLKLGEFFLVHNGNINFSNEVKEKYPNLNDSNIFVKIIEESKEESWNCIFSKIIKEIPGVYNIIVSASNSLFCFKDRYNVRPLCIGENKNGYCVASESVALGDYKYVSEVEGGELVEISYGGLKRNKIIENINKICIFEYIYFLNPDSVINNQKVFNIRYNLGMELGENEIIEDKDNIIVIGSPDTGIPSGMGFAYKLGVKYEQFLEKNKSKGRSFIISSDAGRKDECKKKFLVNPEYSIKDKVVYFVDDSIVRGNTTKRIVNLLKEYEPKEIHIRISSPKIIDICKFGIDIPTKEELVMNIQDEKEYAEDVGFNSLEYLSIDSMVKVISKSLGKKEKDFCIGCFGGGYESNLLDW
jgi:amidophosphoribosyltransferase